MDKENNHNFLNTSFDQSDTSIELDADSDSSTGFDLIIQGQWNNQLLEEIRDFLNLR